MAERTIQIADKPTEDEILALLKNSEIGLAALRELLGHSADAETMAVIKALLENGTYGLNAIKTAVNGRANETTAAAIKALLENGTYGLNALDKDLGTIVNYLAHGTYGLNAIRSAITGRANETTSVAIKSLLENGTYGLNALKTAITGNVKTIKSVQRGLANCTGVLFNISISSVVVSKAFVIAQAAVHNGGTSVTNLPVFIQLVNSTTIQVGTQASSGKLAWQVVEFY